MPVLSIAKMEEDEYNVSKASHTIMTSRFRGSLVSAVQYG